MPCLSNSGGAPIFESLKTLPRNGKDYSSTLLITGFMVKFWKVLKEDISKSKLITQNHEHK